MFMFAFFFFFVLKMSISDPRNPNKRQEKYTNGRNAESFDPRTTYCRPSMRIHVESNTVKYPRTIKSDDVILTPDFEPDVTVYDTLVSEMQDLQSRSIKDTEYISWACGTHLLVKNPVESPTFQRIIRRMCEYYEVDQNTISVRYNMYKDDVDWKAFHFDSAAFNKERAKNQNITAKWLLRPTAYELAFINGVIDSDDSDSN